MTASYDEADVCRRRSAERGNSGAEAACVLPKDDGQLQQLLHWCLVSAAVLVKQVKLQTAV